MHTILLGTCALALGCGARAAPAPPSQPWERTGALEHAMMNCPSAISGAKTRLQMQPDGVDVIVTVEEAGLREYVLELAEYHARLGPPLEDRGEHSGFHGGPGTIGHCPIIHDQTIVTYTPLANGAIIHVKARAPGDVKSVQDQTAGRAASLPRWLPH